MQHVLPQKSAFGQSLEEAVNKYQGPVEALFYMRILQRGHPILPKTRVKPMTYRTVLEEYERTNGEQTIEAWLAAEEKPVPGEKDPKKPLKKISYHKRLINAVVNAMTVPTYIAAKTFIINLQSTYVPPKKDNELWYSINPLFNAFPESYVKIIAVKKLGLMQLNAMVRPHASTASRQQKKDVAIYTAYSMLERDMKLDETATVFRRKDYERYKELKELAERGEFTVRPLGLFI